MYICLCMLTSLKCIRKSPVWTRNQHCDSLPSSALPPLVLGELGLLSINTCASSSLINGIGKVVPALPTVVDGDDVICEIPCKECPLKGSVSRQPRLPEKEDKIRRMHCITLHYSRHSFLSFMSKWKKQVKIRYKNAALRATSLLVLISRNSSSGLTPKVLIGRGVLRAAWGAGGSAKQRNRGTIALQFCCFSNRGTLVKSVFLSFCVLIWKNGKKCLASWDCDVEQIIP